MSIKLMTKIWDCDYGQGTKLLLLLALADMANDEGYCWPSYKTLARKIRVGEHHTIMLMNELVADGWITKEVRHRQDDPASQTSNGYWIKIPTGKGGVTSTSPGGLSVDNPGGLPADNPNHHIEPPVEPPLNIYGEIFSKLDSMIGCVIGGNSDVDTAEIMLEEFGVERFKKAAAWAKEKGFTNMRTALRSMNTALRNGGFAEMPKEEKPAPKKYRQVEHIINGQLFIEKVEET